MPASDRLKKIRESIESEKETSKEEGFEVEEKRDVSKIIERLKSRRPIERESSSQGTYLDSKPLNFDSNVEFPKSSRTGFLSLVGSFYSSFAKIVTSVASFFSKLPVSKTLHNALEGANMSLSVETYLVICSVVSIVSFVASFFFFLVVSAAVSQTQASELAPVIGIMAPFLAVIISLIATILALSYPSMKAKERGVQIDHVLPFALRQLSTQVRAGVSFHKAVASIANSNYGALSEEFAKVVKDLNSGSTTEEALTRLSVRCRSRGLKRSINQIIRSFKTGGSLSAIIADIADDVSFETRMSIRDFTEKLNFINIIYLMVAVVAPVVVAIFSAIMQMPLFKGSGVPYEFVYVAFFAISMLMIMVLYLTKRMEPAAW